MLDELTKTYDSYVDSYRDSDGRLPPMMQLKRIHTAFVVANAKAIADGEGFSPEKREAALSAALLHDTGRYEQLRRYDTFKDSDSVDHAVLSHEIVKGKGWVSSPAILNAILYHNRRELPADMDELTEIAAHTVRDADKLDIFRVLEDQVAHTDWRKESKAFWNLAVSAPPNPVVADCIERRSPVDYRHIRSLSDFVLIQVGWMISGLHFATSRRICNERGHLGFRRKFLRQLTDSPVVDRLCDIALKALETV